MNNTNRTHWHAHVRKEDSEEEDDGWLPGFSGFSALIAMLGAVIITLRCFEEN